MEKVANTITVTLSFGLGGFLAAGLYALTQGFGIPSEEPKMSVYQCEHIGPGHYPDFRKHCIFGALEISGKPNLISCCPWTKSPGSR